jgi:hypothetical protein
MLGSRFRKVRPHLGASPWIETVGDEIAATEMPPVQGENVHIPRRDQSRSP